MDYCAVVYHAGLTDEQDQKLERLQSSALRCIYGYEMSYKKMRELAQVTTLRQRRIEACDKFAQKCLSSRRFSGWFPLKLGGRASSRKRENYIEEHARCNRLRDTPIYYMRRRLNGKEGKIYGKRNQEYRDGNDAGRSDVHPNFVNDD